MKHFGRIATLAFGLATAAAFGQGTPAPAERVFTNFVILTGFPSTETVSSAGALLVPGTVIPLDTPGADTDAGSRMEKVNRSVSFHKAVDKLWATFRLDPNRQTPQGVRQEAVVGKPVILQSPANSGLEMTATLLGYNDTVATYRVIFRQGGKDLANSPVSVTRGGRAVVGGMDGDAAPYIFLLIEPERPGADGENSAVAGVGAGVSAPVPVHKVAPEYDPGAKSEHIQGEVVLEVVIDKNGAVSDVTVLQSPDARLSVKATEAVRTWVFEPARDANGTPVKVRSTITVRFALK